MLPFSNAARPPAHSMAPLPLRTKWTRILSMCHGQRMAFANPTIRECIDVNGKKAQKVFSFAA